MVMVIVTFQGGIRGFFPSGEVKDRQEAWYSYMLNCMAFR